MKKANSALGNKVYSDLRAQALLPLLVLVLSPALPRAGCVLSMSVSEPCARVCYVPGTFLCSGQVPTNDSCSYWGGCCWAKWKARGFQRQASIMSNVSTKVSSRWLHFPKPWFLLNLQNADNNILCAGQPWELIEIVFAWPITDINKWVLIESLISSSANQAEETVSCCEDRKSKHLRLL